MDLVVSGDYTGASGAALGGTPSSASTVIYRNNQNGGFVRQQTLIGMREGGITSMYITPMSVTPSTTNPASADFHDLILSGVFPVNATAFEYATYRYITTKLQSTTTSQATLTLSAASVAVQSA